MLIRRCPNRQRYPATLAKDAASVRERALREGEVMYPEVDGDDIEAAVRIGQHLGVSLLESNRKVQA
jgi:hypothetical protein